MPTISRFLAAAAAIWLLGAPPLRAEEDDSGGPGDALVLVLNLLSSTHARTATGVVLARAEGAGPALVLVAADFVAAGDQIVILDGGTDINRHGRATRTVARSAEAGFALLEAEGLARRGLALAMEDPAMGERLGFTAWPPAEQLAEGAARLSRRVRFTGGNAAAPVFDPALPNVAGPLLNACGQIAGMNLSAQTPSLEDREPPRILWSGDLGVALLAAEFNVARRPCGGATGLAAATADEAGKAAEPEPARSDEAGPGIAPAGVPDGGEQPGGRREASSADAPRRLAALRQALIAGLLGLAALLVYVRLKARGRGARIAVEGVGGDGRAFRVRLALGGGRTAVLRQDSMAIAIQFLDGELAVSDAAASPGQALMLTVGDTPCLPGEQFIVDEGEVLRYGKARLHIRLENAAGPNP